jgi:hypothetical protein
VFFSTVNYTLLLINGSVIGAIFIFFAIASEASVSSVFSMAEKKCSFGFSLDLQESQIAVVIAVGILLVPFSLSSILVLIHNKWANLLTAIGFAFITKLSINLFIYESGPIEEKIEDVLFM